MERISDSDHGQPRSNQLLLWLIVWPKLKAQLRGPLLRSKLMAVKGTWQRDGDVRNLIAGHVEDLTALLGGLATSSRDFH